MEDILLNGKAEVQAGALDAASLGLEVALDVPDSDLRIVGILRKFSVKNPSGDPAKLDEMKVKIDISGIKLSLKGDHPIVFLDVKPDKMTQ